MLDLLLEHGSVINIQRGENGAIVYVHEDGFKEILFWDSEIAPIKDMTIKE